MEEIKMGGHANTGKRKQIELCAENNKNKNTILKTSTNLFGEM